MPLRTVKRAGAKPKPKPKAKGGRRPKRKPSVKRGASSCTCGSGFRFLRRPGRDPYYEFHDPHLVEMMSFV